MDNDIRTIFRGASMATRLLMDEVHGSKNTLSEFMDLSDKLQVYRPKMHFWNLWTYTFKVYGPSDTNSKLMDLKNARVYGTKRHTIISLWTSAAFYSLKICMETACHILSWLARKRKMNP